MEWVKLKLTLIMQECFCFILNLEMNMLHVIYIVYGYYNTLLPFSETPPPSPPKKGLRT